MSINSDDELKIAISSNDFSKLEEIKQYLNANFSKNNSKLNPCDLTTPLYYAVQYQNIDIVDYILKNDKLKIGLISTNKSPFLLAINMAKRTGDLNSTEFRIYILFLLYARNENQYLLPLDPMVGSDIYLAYIYCRDNNPEDIRYDNIVTGVTSLKSIRETLFEKIRLLDPEAQQLLERHKPYCEIFILNNNNPLYESVHSKNFNMIEYILNDEELRRKYEHLPLKNNIVKYILDDKCQLPDTDMKTVLRFMVTIHRYFQNDSFKIDQNTIKGLTLSSFIDHFSSVERLQLIKSLDKDMYIDLVDSIINAFDYIKKNSDDSNNEVKKILRRYNGYLGLFVDPMDTVDNLPGLLFSAVKYKNTNIIKYIFDTVQTISNDELKLAFSSALSLVYNDYSNASVLMRFLCYSGTTFLEIPSISSLYSPRQLHTSLNKDEWSEGLRKVISVYLEDPAYSQLIALKEEDRDQLITHVLYLFGAIQSNKPDDNKKAIELLSKYTDCLHLLRSFKNLYNPLAAAVAAKNPTIIDYIMSNKQMCDCYFANRSTEYSSDIKYIAPFFQEYCNLLASGQTVSKNLFSDVSKLFEAIKLKNNAVAKEILHNAKDHLALLLRLDDLVNPLYATVEEKNFELVTYILSDEAMRKCFAIKKCRTNYDRHSMSALYMAVDNVRKIDDNTVEYKIFMAFVAHCNNEDFHKKGQSPNDDDTPYERAAPRMKMQIDAAKKKINNINDLENEIRNHGNFIVIKNYFTQNYAFLCLVEKFNPYLTAWKAQNVEICNFIRNNEKMSDKWCSDNLQIEKEAIKDGTYIWLAKSDQAVAAIQVQKYSANADVTIALRGLANEMDFSSFATRHVNGFVEIFINSQDVIDDLIARSLLPGDAPKFDEVITLVTKSNLTNNIKQSVDSKNPKESGWTQSIVFTSNKSYSDFIDPLHTQTNSFFNKANKGKQKEAPKEESNAGCFICNNPLGEMVIMLSNEVGECIACCNDCAIKLEESGTHSRLQIVDPW